MLIDSMSKKRKTPIRKCVVTHERRPKHELLRVVRAEGKAIIDKSQAKAGRGAYIIADVGIIKKAKKKNAFARGLRMKIDEEIYDEMLAMVGVKVTGGDLDE